MRQKQQLGQKQSLKLAPQQLQLLNLLQLSSFELEQRIQDEIEENPALEAERNADDDQLASDSYDSADADTSEKDFDPADEYSSDDAPPDYKTTDTDSSPVATADWQSPQAQGKDFREQLHDQLSVLPLSPRERSLVAYLADSLDDDGYLRNDLADLADTLSFAHGLLVDEAELIGAVEVLQGLEPVGIGARDLRECLLLQLEAQHHHTEHIALAHQIVADHLHDFAQHSLEKIARQLGISALQVQHAAALIGRLTPRPAGGNTTELAKNRHIIPEFVVEKSEQGHLRVSLAQSNSDRLRLSPDMAETLRTLQQHAPKAQEKAAARYLRSKTESALWFIDMVRQREHSMLSTMQTIVALQADYFATGDVKTLRPMILKDVAERTGLDISTISRVTSTKYAVTDFGTVHLRTVFNQGTARSDGELVTQREISDLLADLIAAEDPLHPLSDQGLTDLLEEKGYPVARRTVAKYRDALGLPTAKSRSKTIH